ncbi:MAG: cyclase family protein [Planctomycetes bacterium]|nr:cyclase family protein [Planctomycetota bacterium]
MSRRIYDISLELGPGTPVWPGTPPFRRERLAEIEADPVQESARLDLGAHAGTHLDAPAHFLSDGARIGQISPDVLVGPARVVHVQGVRRIAARDIDARIPEETERLILRTDDAARIPAGSFFEDFVALDEDAAKLLVARGIRLLGIDTWSIDPYSSRTYPAHHVILGAGAVILECLDLREVPEGPCEIFCGPLRIPDGEAAPARVFLIFES